MKVQVLGSGCPTCKKLYEIAQSTLAEMDTQAELEYLTGNEGIQRILELGAMSSPVLVVDGEIAMLGFSADKEAIKAVIRKAQKA